MCGRFTLTVDYPGLRGRYYLEDDPELEYPGPRYNIAPSQKSVVLIENPSGDPPRATIMKWGFEAGWTRSASGGLLINARAETVAEKKSFADSLESRRCIVPSDGFYEWRRDGSKTKTPLRFTVGDGNIFSIAGLWKPARDGGLPSFTILTIAANELMADIHERMPVILEPETELEWIDGRLDVGETKRFFKPYPSDRMRRTTVSRAVNSSLVDSPECIKPVDTTD